MNQSALWYGVGSNMLSKGSGLLVLKKSGILKISMIKKHHHAQNIPRLSSVKFLINYLINQLN